ncbi:TlpA disulfide reductase family protein [Salinibacterium sp. G-O1]|uniref:TlpA family protein disulfide reductase n=1 Tax=Salinibacterium sp. G-O1 TaxID=3046208 RepID=UPI0024BAFAAD|nr:TlpA disulfide reductase family protein [Salinibacterium sp. G-O1]MDJ0336361.1 TlpA disulfide reductase family protein [Salinibacterium sp. G-O1]
MKRAVVVAIVAVLTLAGCAPGNDSLASQYQDGSGQGYISGDGAFSEIPADERGEPIEYSGPTADDSTISSDDLAGQVYVVNFWYASCPPCRAEAPDLKALSDEYADIPFIGINIFDNADTAGVFERKYGIEYPSILDAKTNAAQLAFASAGAVAPNAVPTTLVIDREGRVAARISGRIADTSILAAMIDSVVAEQG